MLDRSLYIDDVNILIKAYLRRGLAYESVEKFKAAINDLTRVRELQPMNKQAQQGIQRCQKFHKEDTGELYMPTDDDIALPDLPELNKPAATESAQAQPAQAAASPAPARPAPTEEAKSSPEPEQKPKSAPAKTEEVIQNMAKAAK